ncbi:Protein of unknown function, partial [Gryllus bimaculatus]
LPTKQRSKLRLLVKRHTTRAARRGSTRKQAISRDSCSGRGVVMWRKRRLFRITMLSTFALVVIYYSTTQLSTLRYRTRRKNILNTILQCLSTTLQEKEALLRSKGQTCLVSRREPLDSLQNTSGTSRPCRR